MDEILRKTIKNDENVREINKVHAILIKQDSFVFFIFDKPLVVEYGWEKRWDLVVRLEFHTERQTM